MNNADDFIEYLHKYGINERNENGFLKSFAEILEELSQIFKEAGYEIE